MPCRAANVGAAASVRSSAGPASRASPCISTARSAGSRRTGRNRSRTTPNPNSRSSGLALATSTRRPRSAAAVQAWSSNLVFPMPAGPSTTSTPPAPAAAASSLPLMIRSSDFRSRRLSPSGAVRVIGQKVRGRPQCGKGVHGRVMAVPKCSAVTREDDPAMEWRSGYSKFNTSARPAIAAFGGQYHLFFKDDGNNDGIMHVISDNGEAWSRPHDFYIKWNTSSGPCPVATDERLHVFFRDSGNHDGLMHVAADDGFTFGAQDPFYLSQNVYAETRGAVSDDGTICLISRQAGSEDGSAMVRAVRRPGTSGWDRGYTGANVKKQDIPSIVVFREQFHVFFPDPNNNGDGIYHIVSNDGVNWVGAQPYYIGIDTSAGPSAVVCNGRLHLLFRDGG